jgi:hypothetical protein
MPSLVILCVYALNMTRKVRQKGPKGNCQNTEVTLGSQYEVKYKKMVA